MRFKDAALVGEVLRDPAPVLDISHDPRAHWATREDHYIK